MASGLPDGDPVKGRLVAAYVAQMAREPLKGLNASMSLNLDEAVKQGKVRLTAEQAADLSRAREATLPSKPPYDGWFKDGKTSLNVKQYIHPEFHDAMLRGYREQGFRTWDNVMQAIDADNLGYVSPQATGELKRLIGSADPRIG